MDGIPGQEPSALLILSVRRDGVLDPIGCGVLKAIQAVKQPQAEIGRHDEGYSMSGPKKIRCKKRIFNPGRCG